MWLLLFFQDERVFSWRTGAEHHPESCTQTSHEQASCLSYVPCSQKLPGKNYTAWKSHTTYWRKRPKMRSKLNGKSFTSYFRGRRGCGVSVWILLEKTLWVYFQGVKPRMPYGKTFNVTIWRIKQVLQLLIAYQKFTSTVETRSFALFTTKMHL